MDYDWQAIFFFLAWQWGWVALIVSALITFIHALDEWQGEGGPLWERFAEVVAAHIPWWLGFTSVMVILPTVLITLAIVGYTTYQPSQSPNSLSALALAFLCGARIGDFIFSHWWLWLSGTIRPNPGLWSSLLFVPEVFFLLVAFGFGLHSIPMILLAAALFTLPIPMLAIFGGWK